MFCLDISITFSLFPPLINHDISFVINHLKLWTAPTTSGINTSGPLLTLLCLYAFIIPLCSVSSWILFVVPEDLYKRMNYVSKISVISLWIITPIFGAGLSYRMLGPWTILSWEYWWQMNRNWCYSALWQMRNHNNKMYRNMHQIPTILQFLPSWYQTA